ncbi:glycosyltransferase family 4 protein [Cellulophaga baltica]|uniref:glycosyltransferase family 4 protein n=1 Tax=Cellulophaga baltica TaxID=76594 RepID=UPI00249459BD|nr:glycosyltransferase family 4 protein [Cellulophaga baltica]
MKPKILFIMHIPPPVNGAALVGQYIKNSKIINKDIDSDYINLTASFSLEKIGKGGYNKIKIILSILKKVFTSLKANDYDLCYMTLTAKGAGFYKDFLIVLLLKLFRVKAIYHFHNKGVSKSSQKWFNNFLYKITFKNTKCILLAPSLYKDIQRYVPEENVFFCPNGIPKLQTKDEITKIENSVITPCKFLFLSNMMEEKGVLELLKACSILKKEGYPFNCDFIGAWSDITEDVFMHTIHSLSLENNVTFHGKKYNQDKVEFFETSDVFVFPTYYHNECFPLVLLEAMQFGLPIISTPEGAIEEIVLNNATGLIIEQQNVDALAKAMKFMLKNPSIRKQYGLAGKKRFQENFTLDIFEKKISFILKNTLK